MLLPPHPVLLPTDVNAMKREPVKEPLPSSPHHPHLRDLGQGLWQGQHVSPAAHEGHVRDITLTKWAGRKQCGAEDAGKVHPRRQEPHVTLHLRDMNLRSFPGSWRVKSAKGGHILFEKPDSKEQMNTSLLPDSSRCYMKTNQPTNHEGGDSDGPGCIFSSGSHGKLHQDSGIRHNLTEPCTQLKRGILAK